MQDRGISSIESHNVLEEVEIHHRLNANIRNQTKTKVKQITEKQQKGLLEQ